MAEKIELDKVYPWIKHVDENQKDNSFNLIDENGKEIKTKMPWRRWKEDIGIFYVIDREDRFEIMQEEMLTSEVSEEKLFVKACENLTRDFEFKLLEAEWGGITIYCDGNFEASSFCTSRISEFIAEQYRKDYIVAIPSRDVVVTAPLDDINKINNLKWIVKEISKDDGFISKVLFRYNFKTKEITKFGFAF